MLLDTESNWACLISRPLPLTITGSPNNAVIAASVLEFVPVAAGAAFVDAVSAAAGVENAPKTSAARVTGKIIFILVFIFSCWFDSGYNFTTFTLLMSGSF